MMKKMKIHYRLHVELDADGRPHDTIIVLRNRHDGFIEQVANNKAGRDYLKVKYAQDFCQRA